MNDDLSNPIRTHVNITDRKITFLPSKSSAIIKLLQMGRFDPYPPYKSHQFHNSVSSVPTIGDSDGTFPWFQNHQYPRRVINRSIFPSSPTRWKVGVTNLTTERWTRVRSPESFSVPVPASLLQRCRHSGRNRRQPSISHHARSPGRHNAHPHSLSPRYRTSEAR